MHTKIAGTINPAGNSWYFFSETGGGIGGILGVVDTGGLIIPCIGMFEGDWPGGNWSWIPGGPGSEIGLIRPCVLDGDKCGFDGDIDWEGGGPGKIPGGGGGGGGTPGL